MAKRPPKRSSQAGSGSVGNPLSERQRVLAEQEERLQQEIRARERFLEEAPRRREEEQRRQRDELVNRASQATRRFDSRAALVDKRYDFQTASRGKRKSLKSERRAVRVKFFAFLLLLAGLAFWLYTAIK